MRGDTRENCKEGGYPEVIRRLLLEAAADPTAVDNWGQTPLHLAAGAGHGETVNFLLENGADVSTVYGHGRSVLHHAAEGWSDEIVNRLVGGLGSCEFEAVFGGHLEYVRIVLENGLYPGVVTKDGITASDVAMRAKFKEFLDLVGAEQRG
ncbi:ankyrin repeat-containing domain protein [Aspergillus heterothallicus]